MKRHNFFFNKKPNLNSRSDRMNKQSALKTPYIAPIRTLDRHQLRRKPKHNKFESHSGRCAGMTLRMEP